MTRLKTYSVIEIPINPRETTIRMEKAELERFCEEQGLPLFSLKVESIVTGPARIPSDVKRPYIKVFTPFQGTQIVAIEYVDEDEQKQEVT